MSQDNLAANVRSIHEWLGITAADSCSSWLPLYHDMGLIGTFLGSLTAQIDLWLMSPLDFVRDPLRWLEAHGRHGATVTTAPNFGYGYTAKRVRPQDLEGMDFSRWRVAMNGAERIDPRAAAAFGALLAPHGFRTTAFAPATDSPRPPWPSRASRRAPGHAPYGWKADCTPAGRSCPPAGDGSGPPTRTAGRTG